MYLAKYISIQTRIITVIVQNKGIYKIHVKSCLEFVNIAYIKQNVNIKSKYENIITFVSRSFCMLIII